MTHRKSAFTITELLVVIVIIAALMLIALPTFQGLGRGSKLKTAAFQLSSKMAMARQTAVSDRMFVAILVPDDIVANAAAQEAKKAFQSFAPCQYERVNNNNVFKQYLGEWEMLPPGVVFDDEVDESLTVSNVFPLAVLDGRLLIRNAKFPSSAGADVASIIGMGFRPDGATSMGSTDFAIYLSEGNVPIVDGKALPPVVNPNATTMGLYVNPLTARVRSRVLE